MDRELDVRQDDAADIAVLERHEPQVMFGDHGSLNELPAQPSDTLESGIYTHRPSHAF